MIFLSQWIFRNRFLIPTIILSITFTTFSQCATNKVFQNLIINPDQHENIIKPDENDFLKLVQESRCLADNTLLIEDVLKIRVKTIQISSPRKWGKTTSLNMLKFFLQIPVDEYGQRIPRNETSAYQLFKHGKLPNGRYLLKPPLISKRPAVLDKWLGQHPVIRVSLRGTTPALFDSMESVKNFFKKRVQNAFAEHIYLKKGLQRIIDDSKSGQNRNSTATLDLQFYERIERDLVSEDELRRSILKLSEILGRFFNKHVYIFIDDYDTVLTNILMSRIGAIDKKATSRFCHDLVNNAVYLNRFCEQGVLAGVLRVGSPRPSPWVLNNVEPHEYLENHIFNNFAINERHMDDMCEYLQITSDTKNSIQRWYAGYRAGVNSSLHIYNPWSLAMYFRHKSFEHYHEPEKNILETLLLPSFVEDYHVQKALCTMLSGNAFSVYVEKSDPFRLTTLDFRVIAWKVAEHSDQYACGNVILKYLLLAGYLTLCDNHYAHYPFLIDSEDGIIPLCVRLPNSDIGSKVYDHLANFFAPLFHTNDKTALQRATIELAKEFVSFVGSVESKTAKDTKRLKIEESFEKFLNQLPPFTNNSMDVEDQPDRIPLHENLIHPIINTLLAFSSGIYNYVHYRMLYTQNRPTALLLLRDDDIVFLEFIVIQQFNKHELIRMKQTTVPYFTEWTFVYTKYPNTSSVTGSPNFTSEEIKSLNNASRALSLEHGVVFKPLSSLNELENPSFRGPKPPKKKLPGTGSPNIKPQNTTKSQNTTSPDKKFKSTKSPDKKFKNTKLFNQTFRTTGFQNSTSRTMPPKMLNTKSPLLIYSSGAPATTMAPLVERRLYVDNFLHHQLNMRPAKQIKFIEIRFFYNKTVIIKAVKQVFNDTRESFL